MEKTLKVALLLLFTLFIGINSSGQDYLPSSTSNQVVKHSYYSLSYNEDYEQAELAAIWLTDSMVIGSAFRTEYFKITLI